MFKKSIKSDDVEWAANRFKSLLYVLEPGAHVRIMSGLANREFYERAEQPLRDIKKNGTEITIVAGPMLSVDDNGDSPLFRLARGGVADLYMARFPQDTHYRVIGNRLVQVEDRHAFMQRERGVKELFSVDMVATYIANFENFLECEGLFAPWEENAFIKLRDEDMISAVPCLDYRQALKKLQKSTELTV
jgi:hypothetical protein